MAPKLVTLGLLFWTVGVNMMPVETTLIQLGETTQHTLAAQGFHLFEIPTEKGKIYHVRVTQSSVDVAIVLGKTVVDNLGEGTDERLWFKTTDAGNSRIKIQAIEGQGTYRLTVEHLKGHQAEPALEAFGLQKQGTIDSHKKAAHLWNQLQEPVQEALNHNAAAMIYWNNGEYNQVSHFAKKGLKALGDRAPWLQCTLYSTQGGAFRRTNQMERANKSQYRAWALSHQFQGELAARVEANYATMLTQMGLPERSLAILAHHLSDASTHSLILHQKAWAYYLLNEYEQAKRYFEAFLHKKPNDSVAMAKFGTVLKDMGDLSTAKQLIEDAIDIAKQKSDAELVVSHGQRLAEVCVALEQPETAIPLAEAALKLCRDHNVVDGELHSAITLAQAHDQLGNKTETLRYVERAKQLMAQMAASLHRSWDRVGMVTARQPLIETKLNLLKSMDDPHTALETFEHLRQSRISAPPNGKHAKQWRKYLDLEGKIDSVAKSLVAAPDTSKRHQLELLLIQQEQLVATEERPIPQDVPLSQLQKLLDAETQALIYAVTNKNTLLWLVDPQQVYLFELPGRVALQSKVGRVIKGLAKAKHPNQMRQLQATLNKLSTTLLGPVTPHLKGKRLVIVADDILETLPFGALKDLRHSDQYLLEHFEINYVPSLSALYDIRTQAPLRAQSQGMSLVYDPLFATRDNRVAQRGPTKDKPLTRLFFSHREGKSIESLIPHVTSLSGSEANLDNVWELMGKRPRMLHLATHGTTLGGGRLGNGLYFSQFDEIGQPISSLLLATHVSRDWIPAELVVLSACDSGLGEIKPGQAARGLVRAFLDAGTARLFVSLWKVDDEQTQRLMEHFYQNLVAGKAPGAAAREARLTLLKNPKTAAPYYWASFISVGDWTKFPLPE